MELTVLGCAGGVGRAGEACSGYLVQDGDTRLLIDCGSGVAERLQQVCPLEGLDHVVLSHWHADHASDAGILVHGRIIQRILGQTHGELRFYAPGVEPDLSRVGRAEQGCVSQAVDEGTHLAIGTLELDFHRTRHPVECYAVRVRSTRDGAVLAYTADGALAEGLAEFCCGADALVAECSLYPPVSGAAPGHMNADDVAALARACAPGLLVLSHLPFYGRREELLEDVRCGWEGRCELAHEFARYEVAPRGRLAGSQGEARRDGPCLLG